MGIENMMVPGLNGKEEKLNANPSENAKSKE